jgi:hypothetical protein
MNMSNKAALETLEARLSDVVRKGNALVEVINDLRAADGLPPLPPLGGGDGGVGVGHSSGSGAVMQIKPDSFYGKKLQTAIREYLELRYAIVHGTNPATPKEIYEAITAGGYQFEAKTPDIAMVGMRALLRKRTAFFHKLPNGTYGLTSWYPDAKKPKAQDADADAEVDDREEYEKIGAAITKKAAAAS